MMKIAYLHYHLKTGGVTTVLKQQIHVVDRACDILVLTGAPPDADFGADVRIIEGIGYDVHGGQRSRPGHVARRILEAIRSRWPDGCDVLHVHNPILAKNASFLSILKILQDEGIRLFLQVHDFAEDGRPSSYFKEAYPHDCHYGVINSRDYNILRNAGLKARGLHKLPNMVNAIDFKAGRKKNDDYMLYPVRAIRRKNIGEAILLSLFRKQNKKLVITLPPNSHPDILSHDAWKRFVSENRLDVEPEASMRHNYDDLIMNAGFILTTSITEGFGFSFVEPWTAGKPLWGRKIPDICIDFENNGLVFNDFYTRLDIPLDWVGRDAFRKKWMSCARKSMAQFGVDENAWDIERFADGIMKNGLVDFGMLDEPFQRTAIMRLIQSGNDMRELIRINPFLSDVRPDDSETVIDGNRKAVLEHYGKNRYRKTLLKTYETIMRETVRHSINKEKLLFSFLDPNGFSLLKWEAYAEQGQH